MSREFLMIVEESAFKTPVASPVVWTTATTYGLANASAYYVRLDGGNAFTMRPHPVQKEIPYGGGLAIGRNRISDKQEVKGRLSLKLCTSTAPFFLSWGGVLVNSAGTAPWTYGGSTGGDLASCSVYHGIVRSDFSIKRRVYLGTKVAGWDLETSEDSTDVTLHLDLLASTPQGNQFDSSLDPTSVVFPAPADDNFSDDFMVFTHAGGASFIDYGGTVRTQFTDLHVSVRNKIARKYFANKYVQLLENFGRDTTIATKLLYAPTPDDRTNYEGLTSEAVSIKINNGTHGFTIGCNAQNVFEQLEDDLPLQDFYMQTSTEKNLYDPVAGSDFTLTFS